MKALDYLNRKRTSLSVISPESISNAVELAKLEGQMEAFERMKLHDKSGKSSVLMSEVCFKHKQLQEKLGEWVGVL